MAYISERKLKNTKYYCLVESYRDNGKVKLNQTYLGTKCPLAKSRGWTNLSPEIVTWLKDRAKQKTKPIITLPEQNGKYRTIVIDPPWPMERIDLLANTTVKPFDYPTMTITQIKHDRKLLPIRKLINKNGCFLFLWTTQKFLFNSFDIMAEWGLKPLFTMVWDKGHGMKVVGLPIFDCEFILVGKKGTINFTTTKDFRTTLEAPRRKHSQKPPEFYELLTRVTPEPRIDMFSREKHKGFDQWGNETDKY